MAFFGPLSLCKSILPFLRSWKPYETTFVVLFLDSCFSFSEAEKSLSGAEQSLERYSKEGGGMGSQLDVEIASARGRLVVRV